MSGHVVVSLGSVGVAKLIELRLVGMLDFWDLKLLVVVDVVPKCYLVLQNREEIALRSRDVLLLFQLDVYASIRRGVLPGQLVERFNTWLSNRIPCVFIQVYVYLAVRLARV